MHAFTMVTRFLSFPTDMVFTSNTSPPTLQTSIQLKRHFHKSSPSTKETMMFFLSAQAYEIIYDLYVAMNVVSPADAMGYFIHTGYF